MMKLLNTKRIKSNYVRVGGNGGICKEQEGIQLLKFSLQNSEEKLFLTICAEPNCQLSMRKKIKIISDL